MTEPQSQKTPWYQTRAAYGILTAVIAASAAGVTALLMNIADRKAEQRRPFVRVAEVGENVTDPAKWGFNWPAQYDSYKKTALRTSTKYGGHAGSEALPEQKIERDPWLKRMFLGYAFSIDYRDRRGHAYMLHDQEVTQRLTKPQSGSCLHCHASIMPLYRELGNGDAMLGFEKSFTFSYQELNKKLHDAGHAHPVSCVDCHDPESMNIRVTRPGFIKGIAALAASDDEVPALPSIQLWRERATAPRLMIPMNTLAETKCARSCVGSVTWNTTAALKCRSPSPGARDCRQTMLKPSGTKPSSWMEPRS